MHQSTFAAVRARLADYLQSELIPFEQARGLGYEIVHHRLELYARKQRRE